jgi:hypothetical protein
MTFFLGANGNVRLRRSTSTKVGELSDSISPDDINTSLNRLSFDSADTNLLTGDRVDISTTDARGLVCFPASTWSSATVEPSISAYVNVNTVGGLRFYRSFNNAINNTRTEELPLAAFTGNSLQISYAVRDISYNVLGNVINYSFNTSRESIDTTGLSDKFRQLYSAGLLSGGGTIECLFDYSSTGTKETPLLMLQLIQRLDIGSQFDCALYLTDSETAPDIKNVFYQFDAMVTKAGIQVSPGDVISATIDFVTTGDIRLLLGSVDEYILKEDDDRIELEQGLDYLLKEIVD